MGLLSLFGKGPLSDKKIAKVAKLAANPFAQPDVRMREMQRLVQDGSDTALRGVLRRFAANAQGHIADEDEKKWLEDAVVERGEDALPALRDYIATEEKLTYALGAFRRIAGDVTAVGYFLEVLTRYGPEDYRSGEAKQQILWQLSELMSDARVLPGVCPFLADHSDDVRWAILTMVEVAAKEGTLSPELQGRLAEEMGKLVTADSGPRIARRTAELLATLEWPVGGEAETLVPELEDAFFLDKKRYVRRRGKKT